MRLGAKLGPSSRMFEIVNFPCDIVRSDGDVGCPTAAQLKSGRSLSKSGFATMGARAGVGG